MTQRRHASCFYWRPGRLLVETIGFLPSSTVVTQSGKNSLPRKPPVCNTGRCGVWGGAAAEIEFGAF